MRVHLIASMLVLAASAARAQVPATTAPGESPVPVVVTTGEGVVKRAPDRAWVTIAAESRARTPQEAQRLNTQAMTTVNDKLKGAGVAAEAIQTTAYDLQPEYDYADGKQTLRDYVARNQIQVRVDDLAKLGELVALAVGSGATNVSGIRFDLKDRDAVERDALRRAVADAKARADAAAAGAGAQVARILRIEEAGSAPPQPPRPVPMVERMSMQASAPVPMESGEIEVRVTVTLTAEIR
ncbi:MAG TPA: SIMPL domain-containing protein [Vicinamibacterales bacterium]|nr:SIMPL domain-containing protein [Vicinamibacterales bacterium]